MAVNPTERTALGIVVHVVALFSSILGSGLIYLVSRSSFTNENARNALNWHILFTVVGLAVGIPSVLIGGPLVVVGAFLIVAGGFATIAFTIVATVKAAGGTSWTYPLAPEFV